MTTTYTTQGAVTGTCGHHHRTVEAAEECRAANNRAIKRHNGANSYSDRRVVAVEDSTIRPLTDAEQDDVYDYMSAR